MSFEDDFVEDDNEMNMIDEEGLSDSEAESHSDSDPENEITEKLAEPSKTAIYNRDGLLDKLQDISWPEDVDWSHKLTVEIDQGQAVDVNDDLAKGRDRRLPNSRKWNCLSSGHRITMRRW